MSDLAAFRARIDITEIAEQLELSVRRSGAGGVMSCPFHDDADPSCSLDSARGRFRCWAGSCGAKGDVFDLVQHVRGVPMGDAIAWIAEVTGLEPPARTPGQAAFATSLRAIRGALLTARGETDRPLPFDLASDEADRLGLGLAEGLEPIVATLPNHLVTEPEAADWEGRWTLELAVRGETIGFGAFVADAAAPGGLGAFVPAMAVRGPAFAGLAGARATVGRERTILVTPRAAELVELRSAGLEGIVAPAGLLDDAHAAALVALAPRVGLVWPAASARDPRFAPVLFTLQRAGARVFIVFRDGARLTPPVPLFAYLARALGTSAPERREAIVAAYLRAVGSPTTRALYTAELRSLDLLD